MSMSALEISTHATTIAAKISMRAPESVSRCERRDTGWAVHVEVLDQKGRLADNDVLATYELHFDINGELQGYDRLRRYTRASTGSVSAA